MSVCVDIVGCLPLLFSATAWTIDFGDVAVKSRKPSTATAAAKVSRHVALRKFFRPECSALEDTATKHVRCCFVRLWALARDRS